MCITLASNKQQVSSDIVMRLLKKIKIFFKTLVFSFGSKIKISPNLCWKQMSYISYVVAPNNNTCACPEIALIKITTYI